MLSVEQNEWLQSGDGVLKRRRRCCRTNAAGGRTLMQSNPMRGLEPPAPTVARDLTHADAPQPTKTEGVGVRVTAQHSLQSTPGEGHLQNLLNQ